MDGCPTSMERMSLKSLLFWYCQQLLTSILTFSIASIIISCHLWSSGVCIDLFKVFTLNHATSMTVFLNFTMNVSLLQIILVARRRILRGYVGKHSNFSECWSIMLLYWFRTALVWDVSLSLDTLSRKR